MKKDNEDDIIVNDEQDVVVIEDDSSASGELDSTKEEAKEKRPAKKRGNDNQKRINELWLAKKAAMEESEKNANLAASATAKNSEYEKITASALEENINTKRDLLTERLIRAQESGDTKRTAELTVELGKIEAQAAQIERYKIEKQVDVRQPQQQQHQQNQQPQREISLDELRDSLPPAGQNWIDNNRGWYDPESDEYDQEKAADITHYARMLEANPHPDYPPGSRAYFKKIDSYIKENWSDDVENDSENASQPAQQKKNYAAPVGNRSANNPSPGVRKEYKISQAEKELALSLDTKDRTGKPLSDNEKIKRFVTLREETPSAGPISMKTIGKVN